MGSDEKPLAVNEALFRETNERIEDRVRLFTAEQEQFGVICECAALECQERVTLTKDEYELVRSDARQFVVKPPHTVEDVEDVVSRSGQFEIVRKRGIAAEAAEFLAPNDDSRPS
jgi:hypothetical protein